MYGACVPLLLVVALSSASARKTSPHVVFIVGDDVGYSDFGYFNDNKTITPTIDGLLEKGIFLSDYYTFKICSPSRAAMLTGRYPWGAGFYDMAQDDNHCTTNSTALPQLLKPLGYKTHGTQHACLNEPRLHLGSRSLAHALSF